MTDGKIRVRGHVSGVMLLVSAVTLAAAVFLAATLPPAAGLRELAPLLAVILVGATVLVALSLVRWHADRGLGRQIGDLVDSSRRAQEVYRLDPLTGTFSRAHFLVTFRSLMNSDPGKSGLALLLIDIDQFKLVNDTFGHDMGDAVLAHVGRILTTRFPGAVAGRLGGDEFALALVGPVSEKTCYWVGERVREALREQTRLLQRTIRTDVTVGIAWAPEHSTSADDLMSRADLALYEAKRAGRRCVRVFDAALMKKRTQAAFIARELRAAVLLDHLELHYQPIVNLPGGEIVALEALVRWRHPVRGLIPPVEFIPVAEESALIELLGEWVLRRACRDAHLWPDAVRIGVNVSPRQVQRPEFAETVLRIVAEEGVDPRRIVLEVTETVLLECTGSHKARLATLRAAGMRLALDDFGAGHSSLRHLREFTFDALKIDRAYVKDLGRAEEDRTFVTAISHIGRGLGVTVVGEGVETQEQMRMLHAAGCTLAQGFYFSKPVPVEQAATLFRRRSDQDEAASPLPPLPRPPLPRPRLPRPRLPRPAAG